jgi:proliferating cell nuclear antigen
MSESESESDHSTDNEEDIEIGGSGGDTGGSGVSHIEEMGEEYLSKYCLYIKTSQSNIIKTLFESLKNILEDVNIVCNERGMSIIATNKVKIAFVHLDLLAEKFREGGIYHCPKPVSLGINIPSFFRCISAIGLNDLVTFFMKEEDVMRQEYKINIHIAKAGNYQHTLLSLNLLDIQSDNLSLPDYEFQTVFTIPSSNFQKLAREMSHYSDTVKFISAGKKLKMIVKGDLGESTTTIGEEEVPGEPTLEPVVASFPLKYLNLFTKATNLSSQVDVLFNKQQGDKHMLIIQFNVASLGILRFCLAEKIILDDDE